MTFEATQVRLQAPASNTTQDFEVAGFGTPDAAIILTGFGDDAESPHARMCMGLYDGTNQRCCGYSQETGVVTGNSDSRSWASDSDVVYETTAGTTALRSASATAWTSNGLRLTWAGTTSSRPYVTVILLKGDFNVVVGSGDVPSSSSANITTTGVNPNLLITMNRFGGTDFNGGLGRFNVGFAYDNGSSIEHYSAGLRLIDGSPNDWRSAISNTVLTGNQSDGITVDSMGTEQFTISTSVSFFSTDLIFMALELTDGIEVFSAETPASGDFDPVNAGFEPALAFMICTSHGSIPNSASSGDPVTGFGLYCATNGDSVLDSGVYCSHADNVTTQDAESKAGENFEIPAHVSGDYDTLARATAVPTFDSSGIVWADADFVSGSGGYTVLGLMIEKNSTPAGTVVERTLTSSTVVTDPVPGYVLEQNREFPGDKITTLADLMSTYYVYARVAQQHAAMNHRILRSIVDRTFDAATIEDALAIVRRNLRDFAEYVDTVDDLIARRVIQPSVAVDTLSINDTVDVSLFGQKNKILSEYIDLVDGISKQIEIGLGQIIFRVRRSNATVTDNVDMEKFYRRNLLDTVSVNDAFIADTYRSTIQDVSDSIALGEEAFVRRFLRRSVGEQIALITDLIRISRNNFGVITDTIDLNDSIVVTRPPARRARTLQNQLVVDDLSLRVEFGSLLQPSVVITTDIEMY